MQRAWRYALNLAIDTNVAWRNDGIGLASRIRFTTSPGSNNRPGLSVSAMFDSPLLTA